VVILIVYQGTENAADDESREQIAVEKETGGSYVVIGINYGNKIYLFYDD
jgi:hypothetical protein